MLENLDITLERHLRELEDSKRDLEALSRGNDVVEVLAMDDIGHKARARGTYWENKEVPAEFEERKESLRQEYEALAHQAEETVAEKVQSSGESMITQAIQNLVNHMDRSNTSLDQASAQGHLAQILRLTRLYHGPQVPHTEILTDLIHSEMNRNQQPVDREQLRGHVRNVHNHPHAHHPGHRNPHAYA